LQGGQDVIPTTPLTLLLQFTQKAIQKEENMTLKLRMRLYGAVVIAGVLALAVVSGLMVARLNSTFKGLLKSEIATKIEILKVGKEVNYVSRLTRNIMLGSNYDKDLARLDETIEKINKSFKKLHEAARSTEEQTMVEQAKKDALAFVQDGRSRMAALKDTPVEQRHQAFHEYEKTATPLAMTSRATFEKITKHADKEFDNNVVGFNATIKATLTTVAVAGAVIVILTIILFLILIRVTLKPIATLDRLVTDIAQGDGDLTSRLDASGNDEIASVSRMFNRFLENLHGIIRQVADTSHQVASAADKLNSTAEEIAKGAEEVAAQTTTVATASEEMSATSGDIAQNCMMAVEAAQSASQAAQNGSEVVSTTIHAMEQIASQVRTSARSVSALGARSEQIGAIVGAIEDIADQTNLLALNAAIEAARAGEQGRGFAVVADEVRALAERTTKATKEISTMIKAIQDDTNTAVTQMENGVREVETGSENASRSGEALQEILSRINDVTMQINQIATAAEEQTATTSEIAGNISQITTVVHQTASGAHASATTSAHLNKNAEDLRRLVGKFKL
jgi:methyl-accepting chemotaxis protein